MPTINYTVKPGDTLLAIARQYGTTVQAIAAANRLVNPNLIYPGTVLVIPVEVMEPPGGPPPGGSFYTVRAGDTLYGIARMFKISVESIVSLNNIADPDQIQPGQRLLLPADAVESGLFNYVVQPGDTLYAIARRFGTTVSELLRVNELANPALIEVGQIIRVPVPGMAQAIYRGNATKKKIALTFDATYGDNQTTALLQILRQNNIRATFFLSGIWPEAFPQLARDIAATGHEIGNHSYSHPHLPQLSLIEVRNQILRTGEIIRNFTGRMPYLFRPPFGEYTQEILNITAGLGYLTIMWTIDSLDWQNPGVQQISDRVLENAVPGAIVLMHQAAAQTPQALPTIIQRLKAQGYSFGTVTEVLDP